MILVHDRKSVKIRIDGPSKTGANTTRQILVGDADVDEVKELIEVAIRAKSYEKYVGSSGPAPQKDRT